ncbi:MAG: tRNA preQ1(34) S-adenosylmethionine ribosyltransferase-isomerase QueA [Lachnospiraceae bacterium]|nr:tRNA preQ1(34) S-adenosylmethionine ribosyltransferase-isomerase QueA [Lachnospiraceae bacterium]
MDLHDFYYDLPQELIAQTPSEKRDGSRLMVLDRKTGNIRHDIFHNITDYLQPGDCLVINNTKVIPARLFGSRPGKEEKIEVLLLKRTNLQSAKRASDPDARDVSPLLDPTKEKVEAASEAFPDCRDFWECLVKPGKKVKPGTELIFGDGRLTASCISVDAEGNRTIEFHYDGIFEEILDELGQMPLPPYITQKLEDKNRYQTVYAKHDGSAAAPTAGLHFTEELLQEIRGMQIDIAEVTLHVGLGTFRPVKVEKIEEHNMHSEYYSINSEAAEKINRAKQSGGRVICVGTTSCRTVESAADANGLLHECSGWTNIFIYPGYRFKVLDCLITNFHLPESTLIMLVSALAGRENVLHAYQVAVEQKYRFFSFGDAMLIL